MRKSSRRVLEVAILAPLVYSDPSYAQTDSPEGDPGQDRQDMRQDDEIAAWIGRTFKETVRIGEPTSKGSVAARNIGQAIVDRPRFATRKR